MKKLFALLLGALITTQVHAFECYLSIKDHASGEEMSNRVKSNAKKSDRKSSVSGPHIKTANYSIYLIWSKGSPGVVIKNSNPEMNTHLRVEMLPAQAIYMFNDKLFVDQFTNDFDLYLNCARKKL